jgi:Tfp pilus assembly protein PilV
MRLSSREGFTLVELLVAVLLIDVGVLAMVSGSAVLVRRENATRTRLAAARLAANRIERLTGGGCGATSGSAGREHGIVEYWSASTLGADQLDLADSVAFVIDGVDRHLVVRTRARC